MPFDPEEIDMAVISRHLDQVFAENRPVGYLLGKTVLRDALVQFLQCSQLEAEGVIDTMVMRGFLRYDGAGPDDIDDLSGVWVAAEPGSPSAGGARR